jgi:Icc protein
MPDMNADLRLLHISDPHLFASPQGALRGVATLPSLRAVLAHALGGGARYDALLVTGDIVHDEPGGYRHFRVVMTETGLPVYCLPGNHDVPAALPLAVAGTPVQVGGHVDLGRWRLVLLDSSVAGQAHGHLQAPELDRLERALAGAAGRHVLIGVHHHPVAHDSRWLDSVSLHNAADLFAVMDRHSGVRALVWGHVHQEFEALRRGVRLLGVPSTCAQFLPHSDQFAIDPAPPGYRTLTLRADGSIDTDVVRIDAAADRARAAAAC